MADITKEQVTVTINGIKMDEKTYEYILKLGYKLGCEERKQGEWIKECDTEFGSTYICSVCGRSVVTYGIDNKSLSDYPYCHCGAKMRGSENG